jgi:hypothetical protein
VLCLTVYLVCNISIPLFFTESVCFFKEDSQYKETKAKTRSTERIVDRNQIK